MVNTYLDPKTGTPYDYGVEAFLEIGNAKAFFERFGIDVDAPPEANVTTEYIDFNTGTLVNLSLPTISDQLAAMKKFLEIVDPWTNYLQPGYWDFPQPEHIPQDFLIPYGDFITKYGLQDAVPIIYESTGLGPGNMTRQTTMFELQAFGKYMAEGVLGQIGLVHPAKGGNQALYNAIEQNLAEDVLYTSTVVDASRSRSGVVLTVKNHATGQITVIHARQLLVAIEPTPANIAPLSIEAEEYAVLSKLRYTREYCGIVNNSAFVVPISYSNMAAGAAPDNYLILPDRPFTNTFTWIGENLFHVIIVGDDETTEADAKALAQKNFKTLLKAGRLGEADHGQELDWVAFAVHGPMHARVTPEELKSGFIQQFYGLQGRRSTWWTGGAWSHQLQTTLWEFDETLIPKILANLGNLELA